MPLPLLTAEEREQILQQHPLTPDEANQVTLVWLLQSRGFARRAAHPRAKRRSYGDHIADRVIRLSKWCAVCHTPMRVRASTWKRGLERTCSGKCERARLAARHSSA